MMNSLPVLAEYSTAEHRIIHDDPVPTGFFDVLPRVSA